MNLRSRLLSAGYLIIFIQLFSLWAFYYYYALPQTVKIENTDVEKHLNRGMASLQREFFHLERMAQLLSQQNLIQNIDNNYKGQVDEDLQKRMIQQNINLMYILNNNKQVLWERMLDTANEQPYLDPGILVQLWQNRSDFLTNTSVSNLQIGLYQSKLGPIIIVSAPIPSTKDLKTVQGTLIIGQLINAEMLQLLQSISLSDFKIWPLAGSTLNQKQKEILEKLQNTDSDFLIEPNKRLLSGYMFLPDINQKPVFLLSISLTREITHDLNFLFSCIALFLVITQLLLLGIISYLMDKHLIKPIKLLVQDFFDSYKNWQPRFFKGPKENEINILSSALANFLDRQQMRVTQETALAYRNGLYCARQDLFDGMEDTLRPLIEGLEATEEKLSNLPTNDIEWIIAKCRTGKAASLDIESFSQELATINEAIRLIQQQTRNQLYELSTKALRNAALLRAQARSLESPKQFTPIQNLSSKENVI